MTLVRRAWCWMTGRWCPWEEATDPTIRYLRRHRAAAVRRLEYARTGHLFADQLRGYDEERDDVART